MDAARVVRQRHAPDQGGVAAGAVDDDAAQPLLQRLGGEDLARQSPRRAAAVDHQDLSLVRIAQRVQHRQKLVAPGADRARDAAHLQVRVERVDRRVEHGERRKTRLVVRVINFVRVRHDGGLQLQEARPQVLEPPRRHGHLPRLVVLDERRGGVDVRSLKSIRSRRTIRRSGSCSDARDVGGG